MKQWLAGVVAATVLGVATPVLGYRDLMMCPDLVPMEPTPAVRGDSRRCARAIAKASRRYIDQTLLAHAACLARVQQGTLAGDPNVACRGLVRLSTGAYDLPTEPATSAALSAAASKLGTAIGAGCSDAAAAAIGGCAPTSAGLAACVLAAQREHTLDILDQQFGAVSTVADAGAAACQGAIVRASRRYVSRAAQAHEQCLRSHADDANQVHRADTCLGAIRDRADVMPVDPVTASRLTRARARLVEVVERKCPGAAAAALDACATDATNLARCLTCALRRETMLLVQERRGGAIDRPTTHFVDWAALSNPVLEDPNRLLKNQAMVYDAGWFWILAPPELRRTQDFLTYESIPLTGGGSFGDISRVGGIWYQTTNGNIGGNVFEIFARTSLDLLTWTPLASITPGLSVNSIIDGALVEHDGYAFLAFKDRVQQLPYVTRSVAGPVDGVWLPPLRAIAGSSNPISGFSEAFHFIRIDGQLRIVGTGRDPEPFRCTDNPVYIIYTCSHEPFIYTLPSVSTDLTTWTNWIHKTHLRVPFEAWNPIMHANSGQLADWREHDGFFYLSYAGSLDGDSFNLRGHGKIGLARSRDLIHWRVPGDLRD